jgi:hypothetical protein
MEGSWNKGQAVLVDNPSWKYVTATKGGVMVEALDLAGNSTKQKMYREMPGLIPRHITKDRRRL